MSKQDFDALQALKLEHLRAEEIRDVQIAGIIAARKATLATRDVRHYEATGIDLIDPWAAGRQ